jgi:hypothetical protein
MNKKQILLNQAKTDLQELRKDVEAGLYRGDPKGFKKELERIERKTSRVKDLQVLIPTSIVEIGNRSDWFGNDY